MKLIPMSVHPEEYTDVLLYQKGSNGITLPTITAEYLIAPVSPYGIWYNHYIDDTLDDTDFLGYTILQETPLTLPTISVPRYGGYDLWFATRDGKAICQPTTTIWQTITGRKTIRPGDIRLIQQLTQNHVVIEAF
jgi:hypothetical protein